MLPGRVTDQRLECANISQESKNISIKMLKDVGMTMPKSRETSAVYMQQHGMRAVYLYEAARRGIRAVYMQQDHHEISCDFAMIRFEVR